MLQKSSLILLMATLIAALLLWDILGRQSITSTDMQTFTELRDELREYKTTLAEAACSQSVAGNTTLAGDTSIGNEKLLKRIREIVREELQMNSPSATDEHSNAVLTGEPEVAAGPAQRSEVIASSSAIIDQYISSGKISDDDHARFNELLRYLSEPEKNELRSRIVEAIKSQELANGNLMDLIF